MIEGDYTINSLFDLFLYDIISMFGNDQLVVCGDKHEI